MYFKESVLKFLRDNCGLELSDMQVGILRGVIETNKLEHLQLINSEDHLQWINIHDILYIDRDGNLASFVTCQGIYRQSLSLEAVYKIIDTFDFDVCDGKIIVNMGKVKKYDSDRGKVYFDDCITKESVCTTISRSNINKFKNRFGKELDVSLDIVEKISSKIKHSRSNLFSLI